MPHSRRPAPTQVSWSVEFVTQTPYMLSLGLSNVLANLTWIAGPVTGLLVQPVVGTFSDRCRHRLGRRRPYIIGGLIATVVAQQLYAWSLPLGHAIADHGCHRPLALTISIVSFWLMDMSINVIQTPIRVR